MREKRLGSRTVFEGQILTLRVDDVEAADGHRSTREVIEHPGAVGVVVVHDGDIWLVRQHRYATGEDLLEIPAGKLASGEDPSGCAQRELVEEIGLRPRRLEHVVTYYTTPGFSDELFHIFYADDLEAEAGRTEAGEVLEVVRRPLRDLDALLSSGEVRDSKTLLGLALLSLRLRR
jgi:ADP-ribose pyrophosphatase